MKKIILNTVVLLFTLTSFAQSLNVKSVEKIKTTTIKDSDGEKKIVKTIKTNEAQKVTLGEVNPNSINVPMSNDSPVDVIETTKVSVNGNLKSVTIDHSAYYIKDGEKYQLKSDDLGYKVISENSKNNGVLRKTSNNNYLYIKQNMVSFAYYDNDGNLVIETYNPKTDAIETSTFMIVE